MRLKTCYIAGKISDLPKEVYCNNFKQAAKEVFEMDMRPVSPIELKHDHDLTWLSYMRLDITEMLKCDCVYAQRNWQESKGAVIEINLAKTLGMEIIYQKP